MKGYIVVDREVLDREAFAEFAPRIAEAIGAHGGRFLVRGGAVEVTEGDWAPHGLVIIEFESVERARGFMRSPEYAALQGLRERAMRSRTMVVEGHDPGAGS